MISKVRAHVTALPHSPHCMACGPENPSRLGLYLEPDGPRALTGHVTLDRRHEGWPGLAHGGALATVLDDALGVCTVHLGRQAVTASLTVDFRASAPLGRSLTVRSWLEREDGRKLHMAGDVRDGDTLVAEGRAMLLAVDEEHLASAGQP